jgi:precorrin-6A/cobalt-precorrin-6A reductase
MRRVLVLGGTHEASALAAALAETRVDAVFSYAGRTGRPIPQPLPTRIGGFGGIDGLAAYIARQSITHIVDATHPFAAGMSTNALAAARRSGVKLLALERPPWREQPGDRWRPVASVADAVRDLPHAPTRIFLAIGRQHIALFAACPQHHYLLRLIDPPEAALPLSDCTARIARAPYSVEGDIELLRTERIQWIVSKNAGGQLAGTKIAAARALGLPVTMIARPAIEKRAVVASVAEVMAWLGVPHAADRGV